MILLGENNKIAISRGDSAHIVIDLTGDVPYDGTEALFTVKKDLKEKALFIKNLTVQNGTIEVDIVSQDTNKMIPGNYYWDLRIIYADDDVHSPVPPSPFIVMGVVGDV